MRKPFLRSTTVATAAFYLCGVAFAQQGSTAQSATPDPCSNKARNVGIVGGAVLGALLGNALGNGKKDAKVIGAAIGSVAGGLIGSDMDRKRCELSKIARQHDLEIHISRIEPEGIVKPPEVVGSPSSQPTQVAPIGNVVTVRNKDGTTEHFESGSDVLTPRAKEYFSAIASQYAPQKVLASQTNPQSLAEAEKNLRARRILLVGHTDDTGPSFLNASLSERRAKAVAAFLVQNGVPISNVYYQGAGEALPVGDNSTEEGRAANRRVEIVEAADETGFKKYLENRKPQYEFYRQQSASAARVQTSQSEASKGSSVAKQSQSSTIAASKAAIDFGGRPYAPDFARIDAGMLSTEKTFGFISKAFANNSAVVSDCSLDRPRAVGSVKSLQDGKTYTTTEYLPQLYGKTWAGILNGHLIAINRLAVLRDGATPANLPELKVYTQYKPSGSKKPDVWERPQVNSYLMDKGVLYRMFMTSKAGGIQCIDLLLGIDGSTTAKAGRLIYSGGNELLVADFTPQLQ